MRFKGLLSVLLAFLLGQAVLNAQQYSVSTNVLDWANFCTANFEADVAIARHISFTAGAKCNDWEFKAKDPDYIIRNNQHNFYAGVKYWLWVVFDGAWVSLTGQYRAFSQTGVWRYKLENGCGFGGVLSAGYSIMLSNHFNLDFSSGLRVARLKKYNLYCCPEHMKLLDSGPRMQCALDDVSLSLVYVF